MSKPAVYFEKKHNV